MKSMIRKISLLAAGLLLAVSTFVFAQQGNDHSQHGAAGQMENQPAAEMKGHEGHDMSKMDVNPAHPAGQMIGEKKVEEYTLMYHLLNKEERDEMMKGMEGMEMHGMISSPDVTNHLMLYIKGADGKYASGKVGFVIAGPDGKDFKTLTMGMYDGYGADVIFRDKGIYKIKTKAVIGDKTLSDELDYEVK